MTFTVLAATGAVAAALEIVDSHVAGWDISIVDTVADNASSRLFMLDAERVPPAGLDLVSPWPVAAPQRPAPAPARRAAGGRVASRAMKCGTAR